jgi:hypothetical protein
MIGNISKGKIELIIVKDIAKKMLKCVAAIVINISLITMNR